MSAMRSEMTSVHAYTQPTNAANSSFSDMRGMLEGEKKPNSPLVPVDVLEAVERAFVPFKKSNNAIQRHCRKGKSDFYIKRES